MAEKYKTNDICILEGNLYKINDTNNKSQLFFDVEMITLNI
uniref:Uncharacterized protein n=1 Tax=Caloglossa beccarii TaxID=131038 RepID=A0A1Z1M863_9FLOR|nr:hypothetical protein [Caloglossa beccarii]ARW62268.1 hypothetical protein [Caloglossa beccarii]